MATMKDFRTENKPTWCPGCGDFAVLAALQKAVASLGLEPEEVVCVSGIGCSGKIAQHFGGYGFHSLHGRSLPTATGVKLGNQDLTVIAAGGDGDGYGIGMGHLVHAVRRNIDLTYIVMDNQIYGLTTGQTSPTSKKGFRSKTSPEGAAEEPVKAVETALVNGASFVAQAFSGDVKQMTVLFEEAVRHRGFSLINCFSPCVTFNKVNTYDWFRENVIRLKDREEYDSGDRDAALSVMRKTHGLVTGILCREERPAYHEVMTGAHSVAASKMDLNIPREDMREIFHSFR
ncbi:2-oxoacid:ferredoxin oxidoreductase subunit beta [Paludifilum halophilum]|uniref:2-oxoacid ferredoxin oxidoreductase n=1 Tax=Paludifilum halophilum TaxID=1642702 RepID=A0A235B898_9BACL|nr:2-oxoacid:ferredoxin oxidoreductase subunit beta [Paludifilum halophilum]OYD07815.1 2-oxoacid ferredoxin oxidoreductase [Paludifilum halophilum]